MTRIKNAGPQHYLLRVIVMKMIQQASIYSMVGAI